MLPLGSDLVPPTPDSPSVRRVDLRFASTEYKSKPTRDGALLIHLTPAESWLTLTAFGVAQAVVGVKVVAVRVRFAVKRGSSHLVLYESLQPQGLSTYRCELFLLLAVVRIPLADATPG